MSTESSHTSRVSRVRTYMRAKDVCELVPSFHHWVFNIKIRTPALHSKYFYP